MEDPEVVAAIVAGDPAGLAEAYDRYAMPLYTYCRSILREPADAADAVQDTFLVATARLRDLRDRARLRSWLYAVARNECLRRLRAGAALSALEEASDVPAEAAEFGGAAERAEIGQLVRAAID
jgi:RNA polymerase sigma factor (sigma-70 family)